MTKVLIVDDNAGIRRMLTRQLRKLNYEVFSVEGGQEAIDMLSSESVDIVLLDQMMPQMTGIETFEIIKEKISGNLPVIMITAQHSLELAVEFMKRGGSDFIEKPIDMGVLEAKIKQVLKAAFLQRKIIEQKEKLLRSEKLLAERNAVIEADLDAARKVQMGLLPASHPEIPYIKITTKYRPFDKVGGDFYDIVKLQDGFGFFIADVTGHGVPAAFLTTLIKIFFNLSVQGSSDPAKTLERLSAHLNEYIHSDTFVTSLYAVYHPVDGKLVYSGAGHPPALLYKARERRCVSLEAPSFPLGIFKDQVFEVNEAALEAGDKLFLYTDGIYEAADSDEHTVGKAAFIDFVEARCGETKAEEVIDLLLSKDSSGFLNNLEITDDVTILTLEHTLDRAIG